MKKIHSRRKSVAAIFIALSIICLFHHRAGGVASAAGDPIASLKVQKGTVLVKSAGDILWKEAEDGLELFSGDTVRTRGQSSAFVNFEAGNYVKLLPLATLRIAEYEAEDGYHTTIVDIGYGRVLARVSVPEDTAQFVMKANKAIIRGSDAAAFIETGLLGAGCVDLINGSVQAASVDYPENEISLLAGYRFSVLPDDDIPEPVLLQTMPDENFINTHSCMPPEFSQVQEITIELAEPEEEDDKAKCLEEDESCQKNSECCSEVCQDNKCLEEYIIKISTTTTVVFLCQAGGEDCEENDECCSKTCFENICAEECLDDEEKCESNNECCSGTCEDNKCVGEGIEEFTAQQERCFGFGYQCEEDDECCSEVCKNNTCAEEEVKCLEEDESCQKNSECCSEVCQNNKCLEEYVIKVSTTVTFSCIEIGEECKEGSECCSKTCTDNKCVAETTAPATACEEYPEIFDVTVSDEDVDDTGEVIMESEFACDMQATASIKWSASLECGAITSITISEADKASIFFDGAGAGETADNSYELPIYDTKPREMIIRARGDNEKEAFFTFTIKLQGQGLTALPLITDVLVNGQFVDEGDSLEVRSTDCTVMNVTFSGSASSECGDLKEVTGELDGSDMAIRGRDTWSAAESFSEDTMFTVVLLAEDETGRKSEPFEFEVDLVRGIDLPEVEIESIGGEPVVMFGEPMELYRNDLVNGKLEVVGSAYSNHCAITRVEASVDDATNWYQAEGTTRWTYSYRPSDGDYWVSARSFDDTGGESEEMMNPVEMIYSTYTLEEKLQMTFEEMMQAYRDKDTDTFMENTSPYFSSSYGSVEYFSRLESSLDDKFTEQSSIYIRYQESSHTVSGDTGRVSFQWDANSATSGYSHSSVFVFSKTRGGWKFITVEDDKTFLRHTDEVAYLTATADKSTMIADRNDIATISVEVRDSAYNPVKDGTMVAFTHATNGEIDPMSATAEGMIDIEYLAGSRQGTVTVTATSGSFSDTVSFIMEPESAPPPPDR
ncbi:hypothetical protein ACFLQK_00295 [bacterium]